MPVTISFQTAVFAEAGSMEPRRAPTTRSGDPNQPSQEARARSSLHQRRPSRHGRIDTPPPVRSH
eukprot:2320309-Amphidinium_carterae.1